MSGGQLVRQIGIEERDIQIKRSMSSIEKRRNTRGHEVEILFSRGGEGSNGTMEWREEWLGLGGYKTRAGPRRCLFPFCGCLNRREASGSDRGGNPHSRMSKDRLGIAHRRARGMRGMYAVGSSGWIRRDLGRLDQSLDQSPHPTREESGGCEKFISAWPFYLSPDSADRRPRCNETKLAQLSTWPYLSWKPFSFLLLFLTDHKPSIAHGSYVVADEAQL